MRFDKLLDVASAQIRERVQVICPACGQQVDALATDGRVKGYCAVAKQYVDFLVETQPITVKGSQALSAAMKKSWQAPESRTKRMAAVSAAIKKKWQDPEYHARQSTAVSAAMKKKWQDPEYRAKRRAAAKKMWQDPEYHAKQSAAVSAAMKKLWQDPEYRARQSARVGAEKGGNDEPKG